MAESRDRVVEIGLILIAERQRLRDWAGEQELNPPRTKANSLSLTRELWAASDREKAIDVALRVVADHEAFRAWVREQGLMPPKWIIDPDEAVEKGWGSPRGA